MTNKIDNNDVARVLLLSPAYAGGRRAQMILSERAQFDPGGTTG
jgi:hypothetical protein